MNWTDERVELLKKLWTDGLSASQIAAELGGGVTRNAVIGKVHRLGLSGRAKTVTSAPQRPRKPRAPSHPSTTTSGLYRVQGTTALAPVAVAAPDLEPLPAVAPRAHLEAVSCERVTIMDLRESMCRWPIGDPGREDFRFCGARSDAGIPYCNYHSQLAYQPSIDRRRRTAA
ncbi:GcrA family cell cycle regulator [Terrihabitans sp. B22-R8]|uniref:GcrA family cell cycle regulator n=1 Tax=Terrihabitans sp. B22-R8 TaxID=3425128 RepID=UPI00403CD9F6